LNILDSHIFRVVYRISFDLTKIHKKTNIFVVIVLPLIGRTGFVLPSLAMKDGV
jgi:hypothetical protein